MATDADEKDEDSGLGRGASIDEQRNLLFASWTAMQTSGAQNAFTPAVSDEIRKRLQPNSTLADLNVAEQLLVGGLTGAALDEAIARRLVEAKRRGVPDAAETSARFEKLQSLGAIDEPRKRAFLLGLVTDLQHFGLRSAQVRYRRSKAIAFVSRLTLWAVGCAMFPFLIFLVHRASLIYPVAPLAQVGEGIAWVVTTFPNYGLYTAVAFGALGALFSRYTEFQRATETAVPLDDADAYYSRANVLLHMLIGTVGAMFIYFFAASGLLTGPLVPDLQQLTFVAADSDKATGPFCNLFGAPANCRVETPAQRASEEPKSAPPPAPAGELPVPQGQNAEPSPDAPPPSAEAAPPPKKGEAPHGITTVLGLMTPNALVPSSNLALLIIWAILAGFSERLVPNLLTSTTRQIEARAAETEGKTVIVQPPAAAPVRPAAARVPPAGGDGAPDVEPPRQAGPG